MIYVFGGVFVMGLEWFYLEEVLVWCVLVDLFWIDEMLVINDQFVVFVVVIGYVIFVEIVFDLKDYLGMDLVLVQLGLVVFEMID